MISVKNPKYLLILKLKEFLDINKLFNNLPHIISLLFTFFFLHTFEILIMLNEESPYSQHGPLCTYNVHVII